MITALYNRKGVPGNSFQRDFLHWHPQWGAVWGTLLSWAGRGSQEAVTASGFLRWKEVGSHDQRNWAQEVLSWLVVLLVEKWWRVEEQMELSTLRVLFLNPVSAASLSFSRGELFTTGNVNWRGSFSSVVRYMTTRNQQQSLGRDRWIFFSKICVG